MKNTILTSLMALLIVVLFSAFALQPPKKYEVDLKASTVKWTGYHIAKSYSHFGQLKIKSGQLQIDNGQLVSGEVIIDMSTITDEDLTKEKDNKKLVNHLKSEDFFYVSKYPESKLKINSVKKSGEGTYNVFADITIRGITKAIEFVAKSSASADGSMKYSASLKIDRTQHEVLYGWSLENVMLGNTFDLNVELIAKE